MVPAHCRNCEKAKREVTGAELRVRRIQAGFTLREFAARLGVSHVYLREVELGYRAGIKLREAIKAELAKAKKEAK